MNKIVSPVVPQPGAWKRPPRAVPSGARKPHRRSTSVSESEIPSPAEEVNNTIHTNADPLRVETLDFNKMDTISEPVLGSPLSTASGTTSVVAGEQEPLADVGAGDSTNISELSFNPGTTTVPMSTVITTQLPRMPKFRPEGVKYRYGNYDRYAGFYQLDEFMDVRLQVFQRYLELFQNKDILDIGCNVGHMTITVARNLAPKSILGIDIDKELIVRARRNLDRYIRIPQIAAKKEDRNITAVENLLKTAHVEAGTSESEELGSARNSNTTASTVSSATTALATSATASVAAADSAKTQSIKKTHRKKSQRYKMPARAHLHSHSHAHSHYLDHHHLYHHYQHHNNNNHMPPQLHVDASELFPVSFPLTYGPVLKTPMNSADASCSPAVTNVSTPSHPVQTGNWNCHCNTVPKSKNEFPRNVFFRQTNYVFKDESQLCNDTQQYDLILCLSVTKWIHLNFGDAGLKLAFKRMFNQLRPGGKLILEAQNWASYKKKKNLTEEIYNNYHNIEFFPNDFHEYLLSTEVGFSHSLTLGAPRHMSKGFARPLQLYAKGDYTPNHARWSDAYCPQTTPYEEYRGIYATIPPRPPGLGYPAMSSQRSQTSNTPHHCGSASAPYNSSRRTPRQKPTSQYYNPLETDSYQPSYDMEYLNHMYVFASPLYQTVWSPPASLRNSSSHTPHYGSVREAELDGDGNYRHVYPPNDDTCSPNANAGGAFNSIRDPDTDDSNQLPTGRVQHVYATNCGESSSSPQVMYPPHDDEPIIDNRFVLDEELVGGVMGAVEGGGICDDLPLET